MKLLALDSSGTVASVAVFVDGRLKAEYSVNHKKTHSQTLLPMIDEVMSMVEVKPEELDAIAIAAGPGSFTGLRIGSATAKGLGLALQIPLISVPTLEGMAYRFTHSKKLICPMMDARRNQVFAGVYDFKDGFQVVKEQWVGPIEELLTEINQTGREVIFMGDGAPKYSSFLEELVTVPYEIAPITMLEQSAAALGVRAMELYESGKTVSADVFAPEYLRLSQAEQERAKKLKAEENA